MRSLASKESELERSLALLELLDLRDWAEKVLVVWFLLHGFDEVSALADRCTRPPEIAEKISMKTIIVKRGEAASILKNTDIRQIPKTA